jgi:hypothetical protein
MNVQVCYGFTTTVLVDNDLTHLFATVGGGSTWVYTCACVCAFKYYNEQAASANQQS